MMEEPQQEGEVFKAADTALHEAKDTGRDPVAVE